MVQINPRYASTTIEQAVAHLAEELNEAATACAKSLRFGLEMVNPELAPQDQETNLVWLRREMRDVRASYKRLGELLHLHGWGEAGELLTDLDPPQRGPGADAQSKNVGPIDETAEERAAEGMTNHPNDLSDEEFADRLRKAGWSEDQIKAELERIDKYDVDEAGYDGP